MADDFSYRPQKSAGGEIVVQPNFEIVFLSPSPLAEAMLAENGVWDVPGDMGGYSGDPGFRMSSGYNLIIGGAFGKIVLIP